MSLSYIGQVKESAFRHLPQKCSHLNVWLMNFIEENFGQLSEFRHDKPLSQIWSTEMMPGSYEYHKRLDVWFSKYSAQYLIPLMPTFGGFGVYPFLLQLHNTRQRCSRAVYFLILHESQTTDDD